MLFSIFNLNAVKVLGVMKSLRDNTKINEEKFNVPNINYLMIQPSLLYTYSAMLTLIATMHSVLLYRTIFFLLI